MKFKIGDKVRITKRGIGVQEQNAGMGMIGTITILPYGIGGAYGVDSDEFATPKHHRGYKETWWFEQDILELADGDQRSAVPAPISAVCPRCGGETQEKKTDTYGTIKKCRVCGWC